MWYFPPPSARRHVLAYICLNRCRKLRLTSSLSGRTLDQHQMAAAQVARDAVDGVDVDQRRAVDLPEQRRGRVLPPGRAPACGSALRSWRSARRCIFRRSGKTGFPRPESCAGPGRCWPVSIAGRPAWWRRSASASCDSIAVHGRRRRLVLRRALRRVDRQRQALRLGRLQHVIDGAALEGFDRVLVVGGDEDDVAFVADAWRPPPCRSCPACGCRGR